MTLNLKKSFEFILTVVSGTALIFLLAIAHVL